VQPTKEHKATQRPSTPCVLFLMNDTNIGYTWQILLIRKFSGNLDRQNGLVGTQGQVDMQNTWQILLIRKFSGNLDRQNGLVGTRASWYAELTRCTFQSSNEQFTGVQPVPTRGTRGIKNHLPLQLHCSTAKYSVTCISAIVKPHFCKQNAQP